MEKELIYILLQTKLWLICIAISQSIRLKLPETDE